MTENVKKWSAVLISGRTGELVRGNTWCPVSALLLFNTTACSDHWILVSQLCSTLSFSMSSFPGAQTCYFSRLRKKHFFSSTTPFLLFEQNPLTELFPVSHFPLYWTHSSQIFLPPLLLKWFSGLPVTPVLQNLAVFTQNLAVFTLGVYLVWPTCGMWHHRSLLESFCSLGFQDIMLAWFFVCLSGCSLSFSLTGSSSPAQLLNGVDVASVLPGFYPLSRLSVPSVCW